jgi:hypothetical protein
MPDRQILHSDSIHEKLNPSVSEKMGVHRNLRTLFWFWICMNLSFRGHSCGFTPSSGSHFACRGLNPAGQDTVLTACVV